MSVAHSKNASTPKRTVPPAMDLLRLIGCGLRARRVPEFVVSLSMATAMAPCAAALSRSYPQPRMTQIRLTFLLSADPFRVRPKTATARCVVATTTTYLPILCDKRRQQCNKCPPKAFGRQTERRDPNHLLGRVEPIWISGCRSSARSLE